MREFISRHREILGILLLGIVFVITSHYMVRNHFVEDNPHHLYFIWNADDEGLPAEGEDITIESIDGDTIYLVPKEDYIPKVK